MVLGSFLADVVCAVVSVVCVVRWVVVLFCVSAVAFGCGCSCLSFVPRSFLTGVVVAVLVVWPVCFVFGAVVGEVGCFVFVCSFFVLLCLWSSCRKAACLNVRISPCFSLLSACVLLSLWRAVAACSSL